MRVLCYLLLLRLIPRTSMTQEGIRVFGLLHSISAEGYCRIREKRLRNAFSPLSSAIGTVRNEHHVRF